jgi:D-glycero-D-manno-heptose 1,7-bisphosphate phosphatase
VSGAARRRAIILDRDGTIIVDHGYLDDPGKVEFLPGALEGLREWHALGHPLIVISNQSGIGRGVLTIARVLEINARMQQLLRAAGAPLDGIYFCPHGPTDGCDCRKPGSRLVEDAAAELSFEPADAVVIGDKSSDIELGRRLGAVTMLVSADGRASDGIHAEPDYVVASLLEAARITAQIGDGAPAPRRRVLPA